MQVSVDKDILYRELQKANRVVPSRSTLPILGCILFTAAESKLTLTATDIEITTVSEVDVDVKDAGQVAIPSRVINDIVAALPTGDLNISSDDKNRITIDCSSGQYHISGRAPDEFPAVPSVEEKLKVDLDNKILYRIIDKTKFAVSEDQLRPALTGVLFQFSKGKVTAVATDGHRLAKITNRKAEGVDFESKVIIPQKFLNLISNPLLEAESNSFVISENHVMIAIENTSVYSRIVDEKYPDYVSVIPTENDKEITVDHDTLSGSARRVSIFTNKATFQIKIGIRKDKLVISASDPETGGSAEEEIKAQYSGEELDVGYNSKYFKDILRNIDTEKVVLKLKTSISAGLILPAEQLEGEDYLILLMPIRLTEGN